MCKSHHMSSIFTPRYDPTCVLYAGQLMTANDATDDYVTHVEMPGIWFDNDAFTHISGAFDLADPVSDVCPTLTDLRYKPEDITDRRPVMVAIGYDSLQEKEKFIDKMANILACGGE